MDLLLDTRERAGTGECERCNRPDVDLFRLAETVSIPDYREGRTYKVVVLRERVCDSCYEALHEPQQGD